MMRREMSIEKRKKVYGYIFTSPFILGSLLFFAYPIIMSLVFSFSQYKNLANINEMKFIGLANYIEAFFVNVNFVPAFLTVIRDTLLNTPLIVLFSLFLAFCLNKEMRGRVVYRTLLFLPFILGSGLIFKYLMFTGDTETTMELINGIATPSVIQSMFGPKVSNLFSVFFSRITIVLWKSGLQILLFLSALQNISPSLYESAKCDSATEWEIFWHITIPMVSPMILINIVYTIIDSFSDVNNKVMLYFEQVAFSSLRFDFAAAMSWIYFLFIMLLISLVFLIMRRRVFYSAVVGKGGRR